MSTHRSAAVGGRWPPLARLWAYTSRTPAPGVPAGEFSNIYKASPQLWPQQCGQSCSQGAEQACACSFQQSRAIPWPAPVPFPGSRKWHPWGLLYTVPLPCRGYLSNRGPHTPPQNRVNRGSGNRQASTGPRRPCATPWLHAGPHTREHGWAPHHPYRAASLRAYNYRPYAPLGSARRSKPSSLAMTGLAHGRRPALQGRSARNRCGAHAHISSSLPAGREQCGVPWAPGAHGTNGAVWRLWARAHWSTNRT